MSRPTYDELIELLAGLRSDMDALKTENEHLRAENAELVRRLNQNSRNSSVPPSSEGLGKPPPRSLRGRSGRRPGGQQGHPGQTLRQVTDPDEVIRHEPGPCHGCGGDPRAGVQVGVERRQVFDLPPVNVRVVEHQVVTRRCVCGAVVCASAPEGVNAPVQYGPRVLAIIVYLYVGQFLSKSRTAQALAELFNLPLSAGTVAAATERAAGDLGEFTDRVRAKLIGSDVVHCDETGLRVEGRLHWLHSASNHWWALITCHRRRGTEGMNAAGVLPAMTGIAVHDAWPGYDFYTGLDHAHCNAHLLRELVAVAEETPAGQWCWATQIADALRCLKTAVGSAKAAGETTIDDGLLAQQTQLIRHAARIGAETNRHALTKIELRHRALARRILIRETAHLRFATDFRVPFDNNLAEREIRMVKIKQKVSGCLRTKTGADQFAVIRSYTATTLKHGITLINALEQLAQRRPWLPALN